MSAEEAVLLLQRHERARQGRLRAKLMQEIRRQEEAVADKAARAKARAEETLTQALAARKIQSIWKGALTRRHVKKLREEELAFIGMVRSKIQPLFAPNSQAFLTMACEVGRLMLALSRR